MHDLSALAGFFLPHVDEALAALKRVVPAQILSNISLMRSLRNGLNREYYELTHRALIGHYKLIEKSVSFPDYALALSDEEPRRHILDCYPVLQRWMDELAVRWVKNSAELLVNFQNDRAEFSWLSPDLSGDLTLETVRFGLGDYHRDGKSVSILQFANGAKIVYKPRSLAIDRHFAAFLAEVCVGNDLALQTPKHLVKHGHGWVEYIEHKPCADQAEVDTYFYRLGALLAVLYTLEASDFHYENIIASGAQPMLIDLEAICHPKSPIVGTETNEDSDDTILRTGLLPRKIAIGASAGTDISGMTDVAGQKGVVERLVLAQSDDGKFSFKREFGVLVGAQNVPILDGKKVATSHRLIEQLERGFSLAYRRIQADKALFSGIIDHFADAEVRVIFRATLAYTHLLDEARHPAVLLSEQATQAHFRDLERMSLDYPILDTFIEDEIAALQRRDVPIFGCPAGSTDLTINGQRVLPDFFLASGTDAVRKRIARLSEHDLKRQLWIIGKALQLVDTATDSAIRTRTRPELHPQPVTTEAGGEDIASRLKRQAGVIARSIVEEIYQDETRANWLVVKSMTADNSTGSIWNATYDLYGGMPGEILFLDQVARSMGDRKYRDLADKALKYLEERVRASARSIRPLGLLGGWGSLLTLTTSLGLGRQKSRFYDAADEIVAEVRSAKLVEVDTNYSFTKGAAGLVYACATLYSVTGSRQALALASEAFDHLMSQRHAVEIGSAWRIASSRPLSGLSHGASGFAVAFAKMFEVTGEERYRTACLESLDYERTLYIPEDRNWCDQRDIIVRQGGARCSMSWAHGAPGIGIARLAILGAGIETPEIIEDLNISVRTTIDAGLSESFSIISGDFGRLELPVLFAERVNDSLWGETEALLGQTLAKLEAYTETLEQGHRPPLGFFSGITGVGYQCLRFAQNNITPSFAGLDFAPAPPGRSGPARLEGTQS